MHEVYALKEMLCKQLEEYGRKGELSAAILERVDMLAHAVKNLDKIIEVYEMEEDEGGSSYYDGSSYEMGGSSRRGSSRAGGGSGQSRRRDSMGRYSRDGGSSYRGSYRGGNSYADGMEDMVDSIRGMMGELPQEVQKDAQRFIQKLENRM